jgi:SNF2 family DNA or RNA helicase
MIQVRSQYNNVYIKILDKFDTFEYTMEKIRRIPERVFNTQTGEWMIPRVNVGHLLQQFGNQISWMTPLQEIVQGVHIDSQIVHQHLQWESAGEFNNFVLSMYPYQKVGANFLVDRGSAAVFDGCGLGKTPTLIGAATKIFDQGGKKALIVTLNALKRQWAREIEKFIGEPAIAVYGQGPRREKLIKKFKSDPNVRFLVINYEMLRTERYLNLIKSIPFDMVGLDEAQKIKSGVTDRTLNIEPSQIAAACHELKYIPHRFVATATPIQGKLEEVWSLFYFVDERILGPWDMFRERYCKYHPRYGINGYQNQGELYYRIAPYFIRRTKEDPAVQQQLPAVQHSHVFLEMTDKQEQLHDYLLDKLMEVKEESRKNQGYSFINGKPMSPQETKDYYDALSQGYQIFLLGVCDSPELITMSGSPMAQKILSEMPLGEKDLKSPKLDQIQEFVSQMMYDEPNSKLVIFSKFERMVELIMRALNTDGKGRPLPQPIAVAYHGQMNDTAKDWSVEQFRENPNIKVFVSTDAGSTGLNLQCANYMIMCDLPWDPTLLEQRVGRIDRTGTKFSNITIYYYVMSNSFDEQLLAILERKADLATSVIDGGGKASKGPDVNKVAVERMLKNRQKKLVGAAVGQ